METIEKVKEFHTLFRAPVLKSPQIPSKERCDLRINLIEEELNELKLAIKNKDITEIADALCDLQYVLSGSILEFGLGDKFKDLFNEVHRSNISKACDTEKECLETINFYKEKKGTEAYFEKVDNKWIIYRKSDNKVLKSINYSSANINEFLT